MRYRVTGLAAEAGFFTLLSLPAFVLGLVASAGYVGQSLGTDVLGRLRARIAELAGTALTPDVVHGVILRTFDEVLRDGRPEVLSVGFVVSVWSGSRALGVVLDTVSIMYGLGGRRGIVRTRALSLVLYVLALAAGVLVLPLLLLGPGLLASFARERLGAGALGAGGLSALYWPVVAVLVTAGLAAVYRVAPPVPTTWRRCLPGAALALGLWVLGERRAARGGGRLDRPRLGLRPAGRARGPARLALPSGPGGARGRGAQRHSRRRPPRRPAGGRRGRRGSPAGSLPGHPGSLPASLPGAGGGIGDDGPQVRTGHAQDGGDVGEPAPVSLAGVGQGEHQLGEPA